MQPVTPSTADVSVHIRIIDSGDGTPETGVTSASAGLALWYRKGATGAQTSITESDLSALTDAHSDGGMKHVGEGVYRVDLVDAAVPTAEHEVTWVGGAVTGMIVIPAALVGKPVEVVSASLVSAIWAAVADSPGVTTLLSRLSATRAGYLDNLSAGAVALQSTLTTLATTVSGLAAAVWAYATRTLTTPGATSADTTTTTAISRRRGDRWTISLTGLGDISTRTKLWFTIKQSSGDADADAWLQVTEAGGLIYVYGGGSITSGNASITVTDAVTGAITISVAGAETLKLPPRSVLHDVQVLRTGAAGPDTLAEGAFTITSDVTRAVS